MDAYVQQATKLLGEIIKLGSEKGHNSTEQLSFFRMPDDASVTFDLALDIDEGLNFYYDPMPASASAVQAVRDALARRSR